MNLHLEWHNDTSKKEAFIAEWHRYNIHITTDKRAGILEPLSWFDKQQFSTWYSDFDEVPVSKHDEFAITLKRKRNMHTKKLQCCMGIAILRNSTRSTVNMSGICLKEKQNYILF